MAKGDKEDTRVILRGPEDLESWKFWVLVKADAKRVTEIIEGTESIPPGGPDNVRVKAYRTRAALAAELITDNISRSQIAHVQDLRQDPAAMYKRLVQANTIHGLDSLTDLWEQFDTMTLGSGSATDYIGKFRSLHSKLTSRHDTPSVMKSISTLVRGLPNSSDWKLFRTSLNGDIQADDLDYVISRIFSEYARQKRKDVKEEEMEVMQEAMVASRTGGRSTATATFKRPHLSCHTCGGTGHFASQCPSETIAAAAHAAVSAGAFTSVSGGSYGSSDDRDYVEL